MLISCLYATFRGQKKAWRSSVTLAPILSYSKSTLYHIHLWEDTKLINLRPLLIFGVFNREKSLQFHASFWNCFSHSSLAKLSAYKSSGTMSGWSRQMYCTWWMVSNMPRHSLALKAGGPASVSRKTVTVSSCWDTATSCCATATFNNPSVSTSSLWDIIRKLMVKMAL